MPLRIDSTFSKQHAASSPRYHERRDCQIIPHSKLLLSLSACCTVSGSLYPHAFKEDLSQVKDKNTLWAKACARGARAALSHGRRRVFSQLWPQRARLTSQHTTSCQHEPSASPFITITVNEWKDEMEMERMGLCSRELAQTKWKRIM